MPTKIKVLKSVKDIYTNSYITFPQLLLEGMVVEENQELYVKGYPIKTLVGQIYKTKKICH